MEATLQDRFGAHFAHQLEAGFSTRQLVNTYNAMAGALEQAMTLAILVVGALLVIDSGAAARTGTAPFTIGMLVAFQMFASRMSQPMLRLAGLWQEFQQAHITLRRLADVMDSPAESAVVAPRRAVTAAGPASVRCEAVSFRYDAARPWICRDLGAEFPAGRLTLVRGASGSGKSTLARLLQGFYQVTQGRILIDGVDIAHMGPAELRAMLGVVPQEAVLFAGSVKDNVQAGNAHASFEDIVEACRMAGIHEAVEQLPEGYATVIGEQGVGLSGGQRQRIAIARALVRRPRVLIFDEASANLDMDAATHFARTVNALRGRVTVIFIAHHVPPGLHVDHEVALAAVGGEPS
jgi:subfamily B ATP-binding cassette protein HlyB/CyaB